MAGKFRDQSKRPPDIPGQLPWPFTKKDLIGFDPGETIYAYGNGSRYEYTIPEEGRSAKSRKTKTRGTKALRRAKRVGRGVLGTVLTKRGFFRKKGTKVEYSGEAIGLYLDQTPRQKRGFRRQNEVRELVRGKPFAYRVDSKRAPDGYYKITTGYITIKRDGLGDPVDDDDGGGGGGGGGGGFADGLADGLADGFDGGSGVRDGDTGDGGSKPDEPGLPPDFPFPTDQPGSEQQPLDPCNLPTDGFIAFCNCPDFTRLFRANLRSPNRSDRKSRKLPKKRKDDKCWHIYAVIEVIKEGARLDPCVKRRPRNASSFSIEEIQARIDQIERQTKSKRERKLLLKQLSEELFPEQTDILFKITADVIDELDEELLGPRRRSRASDKPNRSKDGPGIPKLKADKPSRQQGPKDPVDALLDDLKPLFAPRKRKRTFEQQIDELDFPALFLPPSDTQRLLDDTTPLKLRSKRTPLTAAEKQVLNDLKLANAFKPGKPPKPTKARGVKGLDSLAGGKKLRGKGRGRLGTIGEEFIAEAFDQKILRDNAIGIKDVLDY